MQDWRMRERWSKLRAVFRREDLDRELREEIDAHLAMEIEGNIDRGMRPQDARDAARRRFGNRTIIEESSRESWTFLWIEALVQDLRHGVRLLRRSPGFGLTAITVIALGIGATTAAFTLLNYVMLRPLRFADPERLVTLYETQPANGIPRTQTSPLNYLDWRGMSRSFESMGAYMSVSMPLNLSGHGEPLRLDTFLVTADVFATLGVQPVAGRLLSRDDERPDAGNVVLLTSGLASALFGDPAGAVNQTVTLDNQAYTVVGVMPPDFVFPSRTAQLWRPLRLSRLLGSRSNHILYAVARLRAGVRLEEARADMTVVATQLQRAYPKENGKSDIAVAGLRDIMSPQSRTLVLAVFGAAFCLMLIASTNLANLLFARAMARRQEFAIRAAIGAGRGRVLRQLLTESLVVASLGGAFGFAIAVLATPLLGRLVPAALPVGSTPELDWRVFVFATILTLTTSVAFSVGPALYTWRKADVRLLRTRAVSGQSQRLRAALVLAEVVGAVTLLVGVGLLMKALWRVQAVNPGFRTEGVLVLRTGLPSPKYATPATRRSFYTAVLGETRRLPGVIAAAYISYHPMDSSSGRLPVLAPGAADDPLSAPEAIIHFATPGFFNSLGIPLRAGRDVTDRDDGAAPFVAVISESLAGRLWPGQDAIGRQVKVGGVNRTVVGVAGNIAVRSIEEPSDSQIYFAAEQLGTTSMYYAPKDLMIRATGNPTALVPALRNIIHTVDPQLAISDVRLLDDLVAAKSAPRRDQLVVLATFATLALLLAAIGIHGLLSFTVSARTQEIGVRVALGAARRDILGMFLRQGLALGTVGVAVALPLAYAAARGMGALLFRVEPGDPAVYGSAAVLALVMTLAGTLRSVVRAAQIDPATAVRAE
ncbi:MAG TPA: ABC transporter permease [Vicinamibacterales bacterium]|nr:ABC transporter permease [Vicinamibacterales bacterium]